MVCKYYLNINGNKYYFDSEKELDDFIRDNQGSFQYYGKYKDIVFDEANKLQNTVYNKLRAISQERTSSSYNPTSQEMEVTSPTSVGVTSAITSWLKPDGKPALPEFKEENYRTNQLAILLKQGLSQEEAKKQIDSTISRWKHLAKMGDKVHKVAQLYFLSLETGTVDLNSICNSVDLPAETVSNLVYSLGILKERISGGKEYKFIPEFSLQTIDNESDPIVGRIDLLAIDDRGRVEIYDFKISDKEYENWSDPKNLTNDYQLAAYRGLLANNGISVTFSTLGIIPIIISDIDYENETFSSFNLENPVNRTSANAKNLRYPSGFITEIVSAHIKPQASEVEFTSEVIKNINTHTENAFGNLDSEDVEEFSRVFSYNREEGVWEFNDYKSPKGENNEIPTIKAKTKEELKIKAKEYLDKVHSSEDTYYINLYKDIKILKDSGISFDTTNRFKYLSQKANTYLMRTFCNYVDNPSYTLLDVPELAEIGIYAFADKATGIVDIITLTRADLTSKIKTLNKSTTLFGNLGSEAKFRNVKKLMSNTKGGGHLLRTMLAINELSGFFGNYQIGNIDVINYRKGQSYPVDSDILLHNFDILCRELEIENNFNSSLQMADKIEALRGKMMNILGRDRTEINEKATDLINDFYTNYKLDNETGAYKIEQLRILQGIVKTAAGSRLIIRADNNYDSDPTGLSLLYAQLSSLILHYKKIYFESDHDIEALKVGFLNMKKSLSLSGYQVENPEMVQNEIMKSVVDLTELQFQKMRQSYEQYKEKSLQRVLKLYKSKGMTQAGRWTVRDSSKAFNNMFERDEFGKIAKEMRVKNPYDSSNNLSEEERSWLKTFLYNVNRVKKGVNGALDIDTFILTDEVKELMNSGHYFDIPLLRGSLFSQVKNGTVKDVIMDKFNEMVDMRRITGEQEETIERDKDSGKNDYLSMFNFLNVSPTTRENYLAEKATEYWETNLELVEDIFQHAYLRKKAFDLVLPFIDDIKHSLYLQSYNTNEEFKNLKDQIDLYIKVVIFGEPGIAKEYQKAYKWMKSIIDVTRMSMLGFNFNSLFREPIQGFYMLMSRSAGRVLGNNSFTAADALKAYGIVGGNTGVSGDNWTIVESLNHFYGMTRMDANGLAYELNSDRKGWKGMARRGTYWATSASDFLNRMNFLVAQMIHDKCWDAHSMSKEGELIYDWKKDSRYSVFSNGDKTHPEYKKQLSEYIAHMDQFNKENEVDEDWVPIKFNESNPTPLPAAYTVAEKRNIKSSADSLFGYMDHENAYAARHKFVGKILLQFKTYFSSTRERWLLGGTDKTPKGEWVHKKDLNGNLLYLKLEQDADGNNTFVETTEETDIPCKEWSGRFVEGMVQSTVYYFKYLINNYIRHEDLMDYDADHIAYRAKNARMAFSDLLWKALLGLLFRMIFASAAEKDEDIDKFTKNVMTQSMLRSADELYPYADFISLTDTPPSLQAIQNLKESVGRLLGGDSNVFKEVQRNIAAVRLFSGAIESLSSDE